MIGDSFHHRVRLLDLASGRVSTIAGTGKGGFGGDGGPATAASFSITMTATLSPDQKRIYIADIGNHRTRAVESRIRHRDHRRGQRPEGSARRWRRTPCRLRWATRAP